MNETFKEKLNQTGMQRHLQLRPQVDRFCDRMRLFLRSGFLLVRLFLFFIFSFVISEVYAYERIENVYEAVVPLDGRTNQERDRAIERGLEQVLVRYSGYSAISGLLGVPEEIESAQRYVIEYGVETIQSPSPDGIGKQETDALWVRYNAGLVDELAHTLELPIWPTLRPTLSYVLVSQIWGSAQIPSSEHYPALELHLATVFKERGIKASPLSDNQLSGVSAQDIWNMDDITLQDIRARTNTDIVAVIRVHELIEEQRELDFLFISAESETLIRRNERDTLAGLTQGLNNYVDALSVDLTFLGGTEVEHDLYIQIEGMRAYSEYKQVLDQIAGLEQVLWVRMENANDTSIGYLIRYQSNQALLIESITAITGIEPISASAAEQQIGFRTENVTATGAGLIMPGDKGNPILFEYPGRTFFNPDSGYSDLSQKVAP